MVKQKMNDDVDSRQPAQTPSVFVLYVAPTSKRPSAPQQEPPNRRKKPPIDEPPLRVPDRSDPEDPAPAGDPPPKRPPSKLGELPHPLPEWFLTSSLATCEHSRAAS